MRLNKMWCGKTPFYQDIYNFYNTFFIDCQTHGSFILKNISFVKKTVTG